MPTLTQLQYIIAVDRHRHFGKAAKACHVSQPSLSMQLQKAEEELGVIIFDRDKKPILPTAKGVALIEQAKLIVREHGRLLHMAKDAAGEVSGEFSLGVIPTVAPYLVPRFLSKFATRYPKVRLSIDELKTEDIIQKLRDDALDAGLMATPLHEEGLRERILFYEPFHLYLSPGHRLVGRQQVKESDLDAKEIWLLQDGHCFKNQILNYCAIDRVGNQTFANVRFESGNFETLRHLIRAGHGYTLFPHLFVTSLADSEQTEAVRSFVNPIPTRELSLVHRRDHWKEDITACLATAIEEALPAELRKLDKKTIEVLSMQAR